MSGEDSFRMYLIVILFFVFNLGLHAYFNLDHFTFSGLKPVVTLALAPRTFLSDDKVQEIIEECVLQMISPNVLARKYKVNPKSIKAWVKKAGLNLPRKYRIDLSNCRPPPENKTQNQLQICPACDMPCDNLNYHIAKSHQPVLKLKKLPLTPQKCPICEKILGYFDGSKHKAIVNKKIDQHIKMYHLPMIKLVRLEQQMGPNLSLKTSEGTKSDKKEEDKEAPIKSNSSLQISTELAIQIDSVQGTGTIIEIQKEVEIQKETKMPQKRVIMPSQYTMKCTKCDCSNVKSKEVLHQHYLFVHQYCMKCKVDILSSISRVEHVKCVLDDKSILYQSENVEKELVEKNVSVHSKVNQVKNPTTHLTPANEVNINIQSSLNIGIDENEDNFSSVTIKEEPFEKEDFAPSTSTESGMNIDKPEEEVKMELDEDLSSFELMPTS